MSYDIDHGPMAANEMLTAGVAAGVVTAVLTFGLAEGIRRLVAWNGRQRLARSAERRCREVEQFTVHMTGCFDRLAAQLDLVELGLSAPLSVGLAGLGERNLWFLEENYRAFVLRRRRTSPGEILRAIGEWVVAPLRTALDTTRRAVGHRLHDGGRAADRRRLNQCIRMAEKDLVECAFRFLRLDIAQPGEHRCGRWKWRGLILGIVTILALPIGCVPSLSSQVRTSGKVPAGAESKMDGAVAEAVYRTSIPIAKLPHSSRPRHVTDRHIGARA
jgi:hypothetical protein